MLFGNLNSLWLTDNDLRVKRWNLSRIESVWKLFFDWPITITISQPTISAKHLAEGWCLLQVNGAKSISSLCFASFMINAPKELKCFQIVGWNDSETLGSLYQPMNWRCLGMLECLRGLGACFKKVLTYIRRIWKIKWKILDVWNTML